MIKRDLIKQQNKFEQNDLGEDIYQQPQGNEILPQWQIMRLEEIATLQRGNDLPVNHRKQGLYPVVGSNGIVGYHSEFIVKAPGVLVGRSGSVGKVTWIENDYWPLNTSLWVKDFHGNDPHFIYYLLSYLDLGKFTGGVSVPTLNRNVVHLLKTAVPPFLQQQAIAQVLRAVEESIHARRDELKLERERKAALMEFLFTHGTHNEPTKQTEVGEIPESWEVIPLGDLLTNGILGGIQDGNHGERHPKQNDFQAEGVPFITAECIRDGKVLYEKAKHLSSECLRKLRIGFAKPGDVILTHKGTLGEVAIVGHEYEVILLSPQTTYYRVSNQDRLSPSYLAGAFASFIFRRQLEAIASSQSTRDYVGITVQKRIKIPLPSIDEQSEIATVFQACNLKIASLEKEISLHREFFRALLEELMTGRLSTLPLIEEGGSYD